MKEYHKIQTVYLRDPSTNYKNLLEGTWAKPEFEYLKDNEWVWTEKVDGTNIRVMWDGKTVIFGGKTDNAQIPNFLVNRLNEIFNTTPAKLKIKEVFGEEGGVCLYGEGYGAKIQAGGGDYIPDGQDFILFDINIGGVWLERDNVEDIATKLGVDIAPIIGKGTLLEAIEKVREGFDSPIGKAKSEGLVLRPATELVNRMGERVITKIKHKDFNKLNK